MSEVKMESAILRTEYGEFRMHAFDSVRSGCHVVLERGVDGTPLVRVQCHCLTSTAFGSLSCDCDAQLRSAMQVLASASRGVLVYLDQEARGHGLLAKTRVLRYLRGDVDIVEAQALAGVTADLRDYSIVPRMLALAGIPMPVDLLSNNPDKIAHLRASGLAIRSCMRLPTVLKDAGQVAYVRTKRTKLGHLE